MADRAFTLPAPAVRALLAGRKAKHRLPLTRSSGEFGSAPIAYWDHGVIDKAWPDPGLGAGGYLHVPCHADEDASGRAIGPECATCNEMGWTGTVHRFRPRCRIGDRIWIRETFAICRCSEDYETGGDVCYWNWDSDHGDPRQHLTGSARFGTRSTVEFKADGEDDTPGELWPRRDLSGKITSPAEIPWRSSTQMPRWASRLTLLVTDVRVHRLSEIDEADILAEGVDPLDSDLVAYRGRFEGGGCVSSTEQRSRKRAFSALWDHEHGAGAFERDGWCVALTFAVNRANIDALPASAVETEAADA